MSVHDSDEIPLFQKITTDIVKKEVGRKILVFDSSSESKLSLHE